MTTETKEETLPVPAYQVNINETGETYAITSRERFDALPTVEAKADAYAQLKGFQKAINALVREIDPLISQALDKARVDSTRAVTVLTSVPGVTVTIPKGLEDKELGKGEIEAFASALQKLDENAYKLCIEMNPSIKKAEVNKLRDIPGPVAELINRTYQPHAKKAEIKIKELERGQ